MRKRRCVRNSLTLAADLISVVIDTILYDQNILILKPSIKISTHASIIVTVSIAAILALLWHHRPSLLKQVGEWDDFLLRCSMMLHGGSHYVYLLGLQRVVHQTEIVFTADEVVNEQADVQALVPQILSLTVNKSCQIFHDILKGFRV